MSQSLTLGQKIFNQRLLAEHCMSEGQATALWREVQEAYPDLQQDFHSLHDCIKSSNAQLRHLGLEIVAIAMPAKYGTASTKADAEADNDDENEDGSEDENEEVNTKDQKPKARPSKRSNTAHSSPLSSSTSISSTGTTVLHYAVVNKFPDEIAKKTWQPAIFQPLAQQSFVKTVLERLAQHGATPRTTLLNLKNSTGPNPITLGSAEDALERLISEKWVLPVEFKPNGRRNGSSSRANGGIILGPRAFCELSYFMIDEFDMDPNEIPQQIVLL